MRICDWCHDKRERPLHVTLQVLCLPHSPGDEFAVAFDLCRDCYGKMKGLAKSLAEGNLTPAPASSPAGPAAPSSGSAAAGSTPPG